MTDQATTLRNMATAPSYNPNSFLGNSRAANLKGASTTRLARAIAVTSGKGGVGKSNFAVNVSLELASRGRQVSLLDADLALANADVLFGLNPQYHLGHVLSGQRTLDEVVIEVEKNVRLIPGGSGVEELANLSLEQHKRLVAELRAMEEGADYMIIDTAAGIAGNVTGVLRAASEAVIVTTPDPTAVVDAYATIKVIHQHSPQKPIWIVVNDVVGVGDAEQIFVQLSAAAKRFLNHEIAHLGTIPRDAQLAEAVREQTPVVHYAPETPASRALRLIAKQLDQTAIAEPIAGERAESFWCAYTETEV
ncbi:MAG TPA: MinD/ParA family protein [Pyrinomonadaceae bacterium]|nr:MinD/ParA family protein [Pyrinomonadaceae bacterium]